VAVAIVAGVAVIKVGSFAGCVDWHPAEKNEMSASHRLEYAVQASSASQIVMLPL
jgi:hypothetical protein